MSQNVLTATQIADLIKQGLAGDETPTNRLEDVRVLDYEPLKTKRKYPFISVVNVQPDAKIADPRITRVEQKFDVNLLIKKRGAGTDETAFMKIVEDSVLKKLDASTLGGSTLFVENKVWTRQPGVVEKPTPHYASKLAVLVTQVVSTTGAGAVGGEMTLTVGSLSDMQLLGKPLEREPELFENIYDDKRVRQRVAPTGDARSFFGEVEYTLARINQLRTDKKLRAKIACVMKRKGGAEIENFNAFITDAQHGASYSDIESIIIQLEVVP